jgi:hypothetical protein
MTGRNEHLNDICRKFNIDILYAFGSLEKSVRDWIAEDLADLDPGYSDIDIGVLSAIGAGRSVTEKIFLTQALEDFFNVARVELIDLNEADPFLAAEVIRGERLFARNHHAADEYDLFVLRRAGDLAPLERERMDLVLGGPE